MEFITQFGVFYPAFETGTTLDMRTIAAVGLQKITRSGPLSFGDCFHAGMRAILQLPPTTPPNLEALVCDRMRVSDIGFFIAYLKFLRHWRGTAEQPPGLGSAIDLARIWLENLRPEEGVQRSMFSNEGFFLRVMLLTEEVEVELDTPFNITILSIFPGLRKWFHYHHYLLKNGMPTPLGRSPRISASIATRLLRAGPGDAELRDLIALVQSPTPREYEGMPERIEARIMNICTEEAMLGALWTEDSPCTLEQYGKMWETGLSHAMFLCGSYIFMLGSGVQRAEECRRLLAVALDRPSIFAVEALLQLSKEFKSSEAREIKHAIEGLDSTIMLPRYDSVLLSIAMRPEISTNFSPVTQDALRLHCPFITDLLLPKLSRAELPHAFGIPTLDSYMWSSRQLEAAYLHRPPGVECPPFVKRLLMNASTPLNSAITFKVYGASRTYVCGEFKGSARVCRLKVAENGEFTHPRRRTLTLGEVTPTKSSEQQALVQHNNAELMIPSITYHGNVTHAWTANCELLSERSVERIFWIALHILRSGAPDRDALLLAVI